MILYSKELICSRSAYFKGMFKRGFKEEKEQRATIPEEDPVIFDMFVEWLYKDRISKFDMALSTETSGPFIDRIKLYEYGVKICLPELQDFAMSNLMSGYAEYRRDPSFQAIILSYKLTRPGSPLREFMAKTLVQLIGSDITSAYATKTATDIVMENPDLVRDMIRITGFYNLNSDLQGVRPWTLPKCEFHVHAPGAECAYKGEVL